MVDKSAHAERASDHRAEQVTASVGDNQLTQSERVAQHQANLESNDPASIASRSTELMSTEQKPKEPKPMPTEHGGQKGLEPTRYGDWEKNGRCTDF